MSADQIAPAVPAPAAPIVSAPRAPLAFIPTNLTEAWRVAEVLGKAQILPDALRGRPHDILVTIMTGTELGLSPMAAIREIYVVKGKGYLSSLLKVALVKQSPDCEYFRCVESTDKRAVFETKRKNEGVTRFEYTIQDAVRAELVGLDAQGNLVGAKSKKPDAQKDNWEKNPKLMLRRRCAGELADEVYPEITRGCGTNDGGDMPEMVPVNAAPATFAPPPPGQPEDAQVVPPTPPRQPTPEQAFQQAKNEQDLKGIPPAEKKRAIYEDKSSDSLAEAMNQGIDAHQQRLDRQPGDDDGDETPVQIPVSGMKPTADSDSEAKQVLSEVNGVDANLAGAAEQLDLISPRAKAVSGPMRQQIADAVKAKREAIKKARSGK